MRKSEKLAQLTKGLGHANDFKAEHARQHDDVVNNEGKGGYDVLGPEGPCCIPFQSDVTRFEAEIARIEADGNSPDHEGYQWFELTPELLASGSQSELRSWLAGTLRWGGPIDGRRPAKPWHYSSYTSTWARVLWEEPDRERDDSCWCVEINLTPNNRTPDEWRDYVASVGIRRHCSPRDAGDRDVDDLPAPVRSLMVENLGEEVTDRLLVQDFFPQIDWYQYGQLPNTGPKILANCRKA